MPQAVDSNGNKLLSWKVTKEDKEALTDLLIQMRRAPGAGKVNQWDVIPALLRDRSIKVSTDSTTSGELPDILRAQDRKLEAISMFSVKSRTHSPTWEEKVANIRSQLDQLSPKAAGPRLDNVVQFPGPEEERPDECPCLRGIVPCEKLCIVGEREEYKRQVKLREGRG